jgi:hypothetical protein
MGLGKTMQCSAFLAGAFHSGALRTAMIVAPKTLLAHWEKELAVCGLKNKVCSGPQGLPAHRVFARRTDRTGPNALSQQLPHLLAPMDGCRAAAEGHQRCLWAWRPHLA